MKGVSTDIPSLLFYLKYPLVSSGLDRWMLNADGTVMQAAESVQGATRLVCYQYFNDFLSHTKFRQLPGVVAPALNLSSWEAEAGGSLSSRLAWSTKSHKASQCHTPPHPQKHAEVWHKVTGEDFRQLKVLCGEDWSLNKASRTYLIPTWMLRCY